MNVQHDCFSARCPLERTRVVRQEREDTSQREEAVNHLGDRYVLNTGQMRDATLIAPHYLPFQHRKPRITIIHEAARREIELSRRNRRLRANQTPQSPLPGPTAASSQLSRTSSSQDVLPQHASHTLAYTRYGENAPTTNSDSETSSRGLQGHPTSHTASTDIRRAALLSSFAVANRPYAPYYR